MQDSDNIEIFTPEQAQKILLADKQNLVKNLQAGKTLNSQERARMEAMAGIGAGSSGTFAKNKSELALAIGVNRKTIQRWSNDPTFPKPKADGRWVIKDILDWRDAYGKEAGDLVSKESEQVRHLALQNEKIELQLGILKGDYTRNTEVDEKVSQMVLGCKRELLAMPASLAPQVVGLSVAEAEKIIRETVIDALKSLHEGSWIINGG